MARRRMISAELLSDPEFNGISIAAQNVFIRMLSISDDCGVVPTNTYKLNTLINTPQNQRTKIQSLIDEIVNARLGNRFRYNEESYFAFKTRAFEDYQSYILAKSTKSEYLRIKKDEFLELSKNFQEVPASASRTVESKEYKVESKKQKETPADLIEVIKLFQERNYTNAGDEGEKFFNFYTANGWKVGRNPMKNWKAAAANWNKNAKEWGTNNKKPEPGQSKYGESYPCPRGCGQIITDFGKEAHLMYQCSKAVKK